MAIILSSYILYIGGNKTQNMGGGVGVVAGKRVQYEKVRK